MSKSKKRKRLSRMIAEGKVPFNCRHCPAIFANERDRKHHEKDAHLIPQHPAARTRKEAKMARQHQHQHAPAARSNIITRVFRKDPDELYMIDYVTPHSAHACNRKGCTQFAIPITGLCEGHDPVCRSILLARTLKAIDKAPAPSLLPAPANRIGPEHSSLPRRSFVDAGVADKPDSERKFWDFYH